MTATVPANARSSLASFYDSVIGKKVVMAVTGLILFGFVVVHMLGNLQIYLGPQAINRYAELLRVSPGLLWGARLVLLGAVGLHILTALQLAKRKMDARPQGYQKYTPTTSSYASRTMLWSGPILAAFIVYHLLHLTVGSAHGDFREMQVYHNVVSGFRVIPVSIAYIVAMAALGIHMHHGVWSLFQSLGVAHPRYTPLLKRFAAAAAVVVVAGNISIPVSVMLGILK
jgi:succinate dehydrogenase / fumarate reductase, cytochrome b subunit